MAHEGVEWRPSRGRRSVCFGREKTARFELSRGGRTGCSPQEKKEREPRESPTTPEWERTCDIMSIRERLRYCPRWIGWGKSQICPRGSSAPKNRPQNEVFACKWYDIFIFKNFVRHEIYYKKLRTFRVEKRRSEVIWHQFELKISLTHFLKTWKEVGFLCLPVKHFPHPFWKKLRLCLIISSTVGELQKNRKNTKGRNQKTLGRHAWVGRL